MDITSIITKVLEWLLNIAKKMSVKDWIILILALAAIAGVLAARHYYKRATTPVVIVNDSLEIYKNKLNEEYVAKNTYIKTIDELKLLNDELSEEVKNLKDHPITITKIKQYFHTDTIYATSDSIVVADTDTTQRQLHWHSTHPDYYYSITGLTDVASDFSRFNTTLTNIYIPVDLTVDLIESGKQLKFIARSDNPFVKINDINGAVIDPTKSSVIKSRFKQKKWHIGPQLGFGLTSEMKFRPYVGIGIGYGIINF